ncbi:unnamed protein product [Parajaminaea phylloscopi]
MHISMADGGVAAMTAAANAVSTSTTTTILPPTSPTQGPLVLLHAPMADRSGGLFGALSKGADGKLFSNGKVVPALGEAGPSSWEHALAPVPRWAAQGQGYDGDDPDPDPYPYLGRRVARVPRALRSSTPVHAQLSVINDKGMFNGSCATSRQQGTPIEAPSGSCVSYYPDVTVYCCSGISGSLVDLPYQINTSTTDTGPATSETEPICMTNQYSDALACFRLTAESNCKNGQMGPYGVCNPVESDASTVTKQREQSSSSASSSSAMSTAMAANAAPRSAATNVLGSWKVKAGLSLAALTSVLLQGL